METEDGGERESERQTDTETERQTDGDREGQRETDRQTETGGGGGIWFLDQPSAGATVTPS